MADSRFGKGVSRAAHGAYNNKGKIAILAALLASLLAAQRNMGYDAGVNQTNGWGSRLARANTGLWRRYTPGKAASGDEPELSWRNPRNIPSTVSDAGRYALGRLRGN